MANLRILNRNLADDTNSLVASATSGSLVAANLLTDIKTEVHRSTGTTLRYTAQWAADQTLNMAALIFTNMTANATIRARVYANIADVVDVTQPQSDSGVVNAAAYINSAVAWGDITTGVNSFPYGGGSYARAYFTAGTGKKLVIDLVDTGNAAGYIECARLVTGSYWSPAQNPAYGLSIAPKSNTQHKRSDSGDLRTERRPTSRTLKVDLSYIDAEADRVLVYEMLTGNGMARPVFVSLFPSDADAGRERAHQIYGKLNDTAMSHPSWGLYAAPLEVEEI